MRRSSARMLIGFVLMGFAFVALTGIQDASRAYAQRPKKDAGDDKEKGDDQEMSGEIGRVGVQQCVRCHKGGRDEDETKVGLDKFIWLKEVPFWQKNDMHRYAYDCLSAPLGKQMADILKYDVTKAAECLVCHSVDVNNCGIELKTPRKKVEDRFYTGYGMSCEACHGIANKVSEKGKKEGWLAPHQDYDWRNTSPKEKRELNLLDMRHPQVRAEKCASCHVGNSAEGKVVTHDIFAAGHPPLQPLEIVTFANEEPPHWSAGRKNEFLRTLAAGKATFNFLGEATDTKALAADKQKQIAANNYYYLDGESRDLRDLAVGMVATLRSNVKLIREEAAKSVTKGEALDFTHFDCNACHHDLKVPAGRQVRGYDGVPGRPLPKPWTNEVLKSVVKVWIARGGSKVTTIGFEGALREFTAAMTQKPFGLPKALETGTVKLEGVLDTILGEMNQVKVGEPLFDAKFVEALAKELQGKLTAKGGAATPYIDYEVAQIYAWTLKILADEAQAMGANVGATDAAVKKLYALHDSTKKDVVPGLVIDLRDKWIPKDKYEPIADRLAPRMNSVKNFDSLGFRKMFE